MSREKAEPLYHFLIQWNPVQAEAAEKTSSAGSHPSSPPASGTEEGAL